MQKGQQHSVEARLKIAASQARRHRKQKRVADDAEKVLRAAVKDPGSAGR